MSINIIFAITSDNYFSSKDNDLPWKKILKSKYNIDSIREDQMFFKEITSKLKNHNSGINTIIMGRNTYTSIGKPLMGRNNIVISNKLKNFTNTNSTNLFFVDSLENAIKKGKDISDGDLFIIGGSDIIKESIIHYEKYNIQNIYITKVNGIDIIEGNKMFYKIPEEFTQEILHIVNSKYYELKIIKYSKKII